MEDNTMETGLTGGAKRGQDTTGIKRGLGPGRGEQADEWRRGVSSVCP